MEKRKAIIYGIGRMYKEVEQRINEVYEVVARADQKAGEIDGVMPLNRAISIPHDEIILTIMDIAACFEVIGMLVKKYAIPYNTIKLGLNLKKGKGWDYLDIGQNGEIIFNVNGLSIITENIDEFNNVQDIFYSGCYNYFLGRESQEVVLDIGMNVGGASLYFLNKSEVVKVYGFEPFYDTFAQAEKNFKLNGIFVKEKIEIFPYGVSDVNEVRKIVYNKNMTCGQSTDAGANKIARKNYEKWQLISADDDMEVEIRVKDIKDIMQEIYEKHKQEDIVLKLDCEGEEYRIMDRLDREGLFGRIKAVMLEWHYGGDERLVEILKKNQYMFCSFRHEDNQGFIYAYKSK